MRFTTICSVLFLASTVAAYGQCAGGQISGCPAAVSPQSSDYVLGWQPGQNPHTRRFTLSQIANGAGGITGPGSSTNGYVPQWSGAAGVALGIGIPISTSGHSLPLLDGANTWSAPQTFNNPVAITGVTTSTPQLYLNNTGSPTAAATGYDIFSNDNVTFPMFSGTLRPRMFQTTIMVAGISAGGIYENFASFITLQGSGTVGNEVNLVVTDLTFSDSVNVTGQTEGYESRMDNNSTGTIGKWQGYTVVAVNSAVSTTNNIYGLNGLLYNYNTTPGSIGVFALLNCEAMTGGGAHPTFEYCIRDNNPSGLIATLGHVHVGALGTTASMLEIDGPDTLATSYLLNLRNGTPSTVFLVGDDGTTTVTGTLRTNGTAIFTGADQTSGTYAWSAKDSAGFTFVAARDDRTLVVNGTAWISGIVGITGSDTLSTTCPLWVKTGAAASAFQVCDDITTIAFGTFKTNGVAVLIGPDTNSGTYPLTVKSSLANVFTVSDGGTTNVIGALLVTGTGKIVGPDTSAATNALLVQNSAGNMLTLNDAATMTLSGSITVNGLSDLGTTTLMALKSQSGVSRFSVTADGAVMMPALLTGTPASYACFTSGGQLVSRSTPCL